MSGFESVMQMEDPEVPAIEPQGRAPRASWRTFLAASAAVGAGLVGAAAFYSSAKPPTASPAAARGFIMKDEEPSAANAPKTLGSVPVLNVSRHGAAHALKINVDGEMQTFYLPGANIIDDGMTVKYTPPYRFYLMKKDTTDYSKEENFHKLVLPGKTFSVDMDFKGQNGAGCGCNLNFYLVNMPVPDAGKEHDHYCDAQCFEGLGCCHEFDMNEGNMHVQQITNHACSGQYPGHPDWKCHKWGEPELKTSTGDFGRGAGKNIDGTKKFTFSQEFREVNGKLQVTTTISQGGRKVVKSMGNNGELENMYEVMKKGMVFVTGYWFAQDMNWMDGDSCGSGPEHCSMQPAYISNWRITSNGDAPPSPSPSPSPPNPSGEMACCWAESGSCGGCTRESGWCSGSEGNCGQCGAKSKWCPTSGMRAATAREEVQFQADAKQAEAKEQESTE